MDVPVNKQKPRFYKLIGPKSIVLVALCCAALLATQLLTPAVPSVKQNDLWISQVKQGPFIRKVRGVGVLVPSEIRWVASSTAGRVERVLVKPGAVVQPDTVIAELSNPELMNQLAQAQWELDAAQANLLALKAQLQEQTLEQTLLVTQAKMALESAQLKEKAELPLAEQHIISQLDFANTQLNTQQRQAELAIRKETQLRRADVVQAKLVAEEANVRKYRNMVEHYQTQIDALTIHADISGVLQQVSVDVGQRIAIGGNIARVARPDSLLAELQVQENRVQDLQLGFPVVIDTRNGLVDGVVKRIDPRVLNGNVQVDVELISSLPSGARPDLSVTGSIIVEHIDNTLYIDRPAGAIAKTQTRLFTLDAEQELAQLRSIQLGKASVSSIQVVAGLKQGDAVIVSDMTAFSDHSTIKLIQ